MALATILVVEDENIVAKDLQNRLTTLGYSVPATAASGEEALRKAAEIRPDLAVMDIHLKGEMDGIETAEQLRELFDIPPIYLTAYTDPGTLRRARITEPYGYIVKPYDERELHSTIEMALYRHKAESKLRQAEQWLAAVLDHTADAAMGASKAGLVMFINPAAERLTGWTREAAIGREAAAVFQAVYADTHLAAENPVSEVLRTGAEVRFPSSLAILGRDGRETPVAGWATAVRDERGVLAGVLLSFRQASPREG
jgi:PAS domain S-box-containing protein